MSSVGRVTAAAPTPSPCTLTLSARGMAESSRAHQLMGGRWTHTGIVALLVSRESCALGAAEPGTSSVVDSWAQLAKVNQLP